VIQLLVALRIEVWPRDHALAGGTACHGEISRTGASSQIIDALGYESCWCLGTRRMSRRIEVLSTQANHWALFWDRPSSYIIFELVVWIMVCIFFVELFAVTDARVLIPLLTVRAGLSMAAWQRALAPIRAWQRRPDFDEPSLLAAERALAGLYRGFGLVYAAMWVGAVLIAGLLGALEIPEPLPSGGPERLAGVLGVLGMGLGVASVGRPFCDALLPTARAQLGAALVAHRIGVRSVDRIGPRLLSFNVMLISATVLALLSFNVLDRATGSREQARIEQLARVSEAALHVRTGLLALDELETGIDVLDALPTALGHDAAEPLEVVGAVDVRSGLVQAAAPLGDGQWLHTQVEVEFNLHQAALTMTVLLAFIIGLIAAANVVLNRNLTGPIEQLDDAVQRLAAQGDVRALARLVPQRGDEVGALTLNFNRLLDSLDALAVAASTVASGNLDARLDGHGDLQDAFRGMLARLHQMVLQVQAASLTVAESAAEIQATAAGQEQAVERQAQRMAMFGAAVDRLARSAQQISATASDVLDNAEQTRSTTNLIAVEIVALDAQTRNIGELLELIREIADRSDLLALNGALEATRAGEAGRGFALVAAEMRRLAERVTGAVGRVRDQVTSIRTAGSSTVLATDRGCKLADDTAAAARQISTITQNQSRETMQLSIEVQAVASDMDLTVASTTQTQAAATAMRQQAVELQRLIGQFKLRADGTERRALAKPNDARAQSPAKASSAAPSIL
jgi:methyl-accepting chemotaxis protein